MSSTKIPLLNDYKKEFVYKRLPETFFGGLKLRFGYQVPSYVYILQTLTWLFPFLIGGTLILITEVTGFPVLYSALISGILDFLIVLTLQLFHLFHRCNKVQTITDDFNLKEKNKLTNIKQLINEDDEIEFDSCFSYSTFKFIIPPKKYAFNIFFHSLISGILCGFAVWYFQPRTLNVLYNNNTSATVIIFIFSWFSFLVGHHSLMVGAGARPVETATYKMTDQYEIEDISRMFHICIFFAFHLVEVYVSSFSIVNQILHVVFLFLPFLWFFAFLPTLEPLFFWTLEQVLIFCLGGSPMSTNLRIVLGFLLGSLALIPACFLRNTTSLIAYASIFGFILSNDVITLMVSAVSYLEEAFLNKKTVKELGKKKQTVRNVRREVLFLLWMLALSTLISCMCVIYESDITPNSSVKLSLEILFIILFAVTYVMQDMQRVFVVFGIFRNYLYRLKTKSNKYYFTTYLDVFGFLHWLLVYAVNPLLMTSFCSLYVVSSNATPSFVTALYATHAFRMIWQRSKDGLAVLAVYGVMDLISANKWVWFEETSPGLILILLDLIMDRLIKFVENIWFMPQLAVLNYTDKKLIRKSSLKLLIANLLLFPYLLAIAAISATISAPVLPLFTLPIFLVGFPRPAKFWPSTAGDVTSSNNTSESSTYSEMNEEIVRNITKGIKYGSYTSTLSPGTNLKFYLLRSQDRTMFVQTLESGYNYVMMTCKGLELQETSCHSVEVTGVDDMCDDAFDKSDTRTQQSAYNSHAFSSALTLLDQFNIEGYSDSTTSLTGIIDNLAAMKRFGPDFVNSLTWLLLRHRDSWYQRDVVTAPTPVASSRMEEMKQRPSSPPGVVIDDDDNDDFWDSSSTDDDDELSGGDVTLGLPAMEMGTRKKQQELLADQLQKKAEKKAKSPDSRKFTAISDFFDESDLKKFEQLFSREFFDKSLESLKREDDQVVDIDEKLLDRVKQVALTSLSLFHAKALPGADLNNVSAQHLCRGFVGDFSMTSQLEAFKENHDEIYRLSGKAFRYSIKLLYDRVIMGAGDDDDDFDDVIDNLHEYEDDCFIGQVSSKQWCDAIRDGKKFLFAIYYDRSEKEYKARTLIRHSSIQTKIAAFSSPVIRSIWANLAFELLYATNDDDERFSIQAHKSFLRNMTIQSANQPLGYPIYHSPPTKYSTLDT